MIRLFQHWLLLAERIALHEPTQTAVLADVHLGYSAARQQLGDAVPWCSVEEELQLLSTAVTSQGIRQLIVAGDLFECGFEPAIYQSFLDVLERLGLGFLGLVPGNHDRGVEKAAANLPVFAAGYDLAGWHITHGDQPLEASQAVMGHWHPAARCQGRKHPCFLVHDNQIVLPAFSRDAAGVDILAEPRWRDWQCYVILDNQVVLWNARSKFRS